MAECTADRGERARELRMLATTSRVHAGERPARTHVMDGCVEPGGVSAGPSQPRVESAESAVAVELHAVGGSGATASTAAAGTPAALDAAGISTSLSDAGTESAAAPATGWGSAVAGVLSNHHAGWGSAARKSGEDQQRDAAVSDTVAGGDAFAPPSTAARAAATPPAGGDHANRVQHNPAAPSAHSPALQDVCELLDSDNDVDATDNAEVDDHLAPLDDSRLTCTICQEWLVYPVTTHCGHSYCKPCLRDYANKSESTDVRRCPQCKTSIGHFCCVSVVDRRMESRLRSRLGSRQYEGRCMERREEVEQSHRNVKAFKRTPAQWLPRLRASMSPPAIGESGGHACASEMDNVLAEAETSFEQQEDIWQKLQARQRLAKDGDIRREYLAEKAQLEAAHRERLAGDCQEDMQLALKLDREEKQQAAAAKKRQEEEDEAMAKRYQEDHDKAQKLAGDEQEQAAAAKKRQEEEDEAMAKRCQEEHDQVATAERARMQEAEQKSVAVVKALQCGRPKRKASAVIDIGVEQSTTSSSDDDDDNDDHLSAAFRIVPLRPKAKRQRSASPREIQRPASAAKASVSRTAAAAPAMCRKEDASVAQATGVHSVHHRHSEGGRSSRPRAPAINENIKDRGIRLVLDRQTEWHRAVLVDWAKGTIKPGEPRAGDRLIDHRWAVCSMIMTEKIEEPADLLVQLSDEKYGRKWAWEEDERFDEGYQQRQQENFIRSEFYCPAIAYTLWRKLKQLQLFWAHETFRIEDFIANHSRFADEWPLIVRSVLKDLLRDHFLMEAKTMTKFDGTVSLTLSDVRLDTEQFKGVFSVADGWTIWKVSDLTRLMKDVASRIDGPFVQWPEGGVERWISTLEADVHYDVEQHNGHAHSKCCSGCLKAAEPDGTPIDLCVHPMFDNLFMCDGPEGCKNNYENEENWLVSGDGEEACRCCGYEHEYMPLVRCDACTACFCHGCINGQCPNYGAAEFKAIEESADAANAPPWLCFLCRPQNLSVLKVNKQALQRFRSKEADQRPSRRASVLRSPQKVYLRLDVDTDSGDDSDDEEVVYGSEPSESDGDDNGVDSDQNEEVAAAAMRPRRRSTGGRARRTGGQRRQVRRQVPSRVFERNIEHWRLRSRHEPYILIENVKGMSTGDRKTIQQTLHLDMTVIDSVRFSFATRKRLYFGNFDCLSESELPALDGSPVMSKELETVIPDQAEMRAYFDESRTIDSRFIETDAPSHNATPWDKTLCIMPDKGEDLVMAGLNDKLRAIARSGFDSTQVPKLNQEDVKKMRKYNMIFYKDDGVPYLQLRLLTVRKPPLLRGCNCSIRLAHLGGAHMPVPVLFRALTYPHRCLWISLQSARMAWALNRYQTANCGRMRRGE
jgi:hypothetical protein